MNNCAKCGRRIIKGGLCNHCWKEWTCTGAYTVQSIDWLNELIRIQRRYERSMASTEVTFTVMGIDDDFLYDRELELTEDEINN